MFSLTILLSRTNAWRGGARLMALATTCLVAGACGGGGQPGSGAPTGRFAADVEFLQQHTRIVLLADAARMAQVVVAPEYQGRVMTSTTGGTDAPGFGWIGRAAIASKQRQPHMNVFGGEDRFWLGPEGGQYALFFKAGDPFDLDHWQTPESIDWGAWDIVSQSPTGVRFRKRMTLQNYSGTRLEIEVDRTVRLLADTEIVAKLGASLARAVRAVAFESSNTVTNVGHEKWTPQSGLVSVWILGQFTPSPETTIALPIAPGTASINDAYFGKVPADRLIVKDSIVFFRGDGRYRSKIGVPASRAASVAGSYDAAAHVLTLVQYTRPARAFGYVNSMWAIQREPYAGDVINSYNDGPTAPGKPPLGPFYELETSSPALDLSPGASGTHVHRTFHFAGAEPELDRLARATLRVSLAELSNAFATGARDHR